MNQNSTKINVALLQILASQFHSCTNNYCFINNCFHFTSICSREATDVFFGSSISIAPAPKDWTASLNLSIVRSDNLVTTQRLVNMSEVMGRASMFTNELREPGTQTHVNLLSTINDYRWIMPSQTNFEGNSANLWHNVCILINSQLEATCNFPLKFTRRAVYKVS